MKCFVKYNGLVLPLQEYNKQVIDEYRKGFKKDSLGFKNFPQFLMYSLKYHFTDEPVEIFVR